MISSQCPVTKPGSFRFQNCRNARAVLCCSASSSVLIMDPRTQKLVTPGDKVSSQVHGRQVVIADSHPCAFAHLRAQAERPSPARSAERSASILVQLPGGSGCQEQVMLPLVCSRCPHRTSDHTIFGSAGPGRSKSTSTKRIH